MSLPFLSLAYMTNRREPMIKWFFDSLHRETEGNYDGMKVMVIDFYADYPGRREQIAALTHCPVTHIPPKPTVWQGPHRLTSVDYFAASNARNTALCISHDGYLTFVDDLSVLLPGWLEEVRRAMAGNYIALGTYEKVLGLEVEDGVVTGYRSHEPGKDSRMAKTFTQEPIKCGGSWMFGASCAIPTEALFKVNGLDENNDSQGGEDYICGIMLEKNGFDLRFCPRMKTLESEERHFIEPPFKRIIKPTVGDIDGSHRILRAVLNGQITAPNYANMRELRQTVLFENKPFPVNQCPQHHWVDGQPLSEM